MLDSESTRVAARVRELFSEGDGGETNKDGGLFTSLTVQTGLENTLVLLNWRVGALTYLGVFGHVFGTLKVSKRTRPCGVDHSYAIVNTISPYRTLGDNIRSKVFDLLKVCCFWNRNVSLATGIPPTFLLCAGSGHGIPSLLVKYGASSFRFPAETTPASFAATSAGPSLCIWNKDDFCSGRGSTPEDPSAEAAALRGCWKGFVLPVLDMIMYIG